MMQSVSVTKPGIEPPPFTKAETSSGATDVGDFDALLAGVQSVQLAASLRVLADATGLAKQSSNGKLSARQARVQTETTEARQADAQAQSARRSDAASQDKGSFDIRSERALARDAEASSQNAKRAMAFGDAQSKVGRSGARGADSGATLANSGGADIREAASQSELGKSRSETPATVKDASIEKQVAPSERASGDAAGKAVTVTTAGAASRVGNAAKERAGSPAQIVGRALAGRGATETSSAPRALELPDSARDGGRSTSDKRSGANASKETRGTGQDAEGKSVRSARQGDFQRLVQQVRMNAGIKTSSATIRLDPPGLGRMRVDVRMEEGVLQVRVEAASESARALLQSRADELLATLRSHDIEVGSFKVVSPEDSQERGAETSGAQGDDAGSQEGNVGSQGGDVGPQGGDVGAQGFSGDRTEGKGSPSTIDPGREDTISTHGEAVAVTALAADRRLDMRV